VEIIFKVIHMTIILAVSKFLNTVLGLRQWALLTVETWCNYVGPSVNPD